MNQLQRPHMTKHATSVEYESLLLNCALVETAFKFLELILQSGSYWAEDEVHSMFIYLHAWRYAGPGIQKRTQPY